MKDKIRTEYSRRVKQLAKSELYVRNVLMEINQWVLGVVRYRAGIGQKEIWRYWIGKQEK